MRGGGVFVEGEGQATCLESSESVDLYDDDEEDESLTFDMV